VITATTTTTTSSSSIAFLTFVHQITHETTQLLMRRTIITILVATVITVTTAVAILSVALPFLAINFVFSDPAPSHHHKIWASVDEP
jgi:hypothetical protein